MLIQKIHVKEICFIHKTKHYQLQKLLKTPTMLLYSLSRGKKTKNLINSNSIIYDFDFECLIFVFYQLQVHIFSVI